MLVVVMRDDEAAYLNPAAADADDDDLDTGRHSDDEGKTLRICCISDINMTANES